MPTGYVFLYNNEEITGLPFRTNDGTSYPANWCSYSSIEDLSKIGVISLLQIWPPLEQGYYYDGTYKDDFTEFTRTYNQVTN